jgi:hypothetical protein
MLIGLLLLAASVVALFVAFRMISAAHVSPGWRTLTIVLTVPAVLIIGLFGIAIRGPLVGSAAIIFTLAGSMIISSERWKGKLLFQRMADRRFARNPTLRREFEKNRILRWTMRMSGREPPARDPKDDPT